jgi:hypothetical protein
MAHNKLDDQTSTPLRWLIAGIVSTVGFTAVVVKFGLDIRHDLDALAAEVRTSNRTQWTQHDMQLWVVTTQGANPSLKLVDPKTLVNQP